MKTVRELGRFLFDCRLHLRVMSTNAGFFVDLFDETKICATGYAPTFPDAIDAALVDLARRRPRELAS